MLKITIDTSVFIEDDEAAPRKQAAIRCRQVCENLHREGTIDVAVSTRFEADKQNDSDPERVARHFARLQPYRRQSAGFRLDVSRIDVDVLHGEPEDGDIIEELEGLFIAGISSLRRRVHSMFDADHIWARWAGKRDYFITSDVQAVDRLRSELMRRFGIRVLRPEEFLAAYDEVQDADVDRAQTFAQELERRHRAGTK
ncbi:MAG: hypothetical protein ABI134_07690 [Byssovorax sp.]